MPFLLFHKRTKEEEEGWDSAWQLMRGQALAIDVEDRVTSLFTPLAGAVEASSLTLPSGPLGDVRRCLGWARAP